MIAMELHNNLPQVQ